jgi:hypothetical protein
MVTQRNASSLQGTVVINTLECNTEENAGLVHLLVNMERDQIKNVT